MKRIIESLRPARWMNAVLGLVWVTIGTAESGRAHAADEPAEAPAAVPPEAPTHLSFGPGEYLTPTYPGAHSTRTVLIPFVDALYENRWYANASDVLGLYAYKSASTEIGTAVEYDLAERLARDDAAFRHFHDIRETPRLKVFGDKTLSFVTGDMNVATDVGGRRQGTLAQANVWLSMPLIPKCLISIGPGMTWADSQYMKTFFGITGSQSAVSSFQPFTARAGLVDWHVNALATYEISSRWGVGAVAYRGQLTGDAAASPVTSSRRQTTALGWLVYKLK